MARTLFIILLATVTIIQTLAFPIPRSEKDIDHLRANGHSEHEITQALSAILDTTPSYYFSSSSLKRRSQKSALSSSLHGHDVTFSIVPYQSTAKKVAERSAAKNPISEVTLEGFIMTWMKKHGMAKEMKKAGKGVNAEADADTELERAVDVRRMGLRPRWAVQ